MNKIFYFLISIFCISCSTQNDKEKWQNDRDNVLNVNKQIHEIIIKDILISNTARLYTLKQYLVICDHKTEDKQIHFFDKNTFQYVAGIAYQGQGPQEITMLGHVAVDNKEQNFYVSDHGKQKIYKFNLDSVLFNSVYFPKDDIEMNIKKFPDTYFFINDTISLARVIEPTSNSTFNQMIAKWNMIDNEIFPLKYTHPNIEQKRICLAVEPQIKRYVECYHQYDLISMFDFNGELICNIYGPNWTEKKDRKKYYRKALFCKNHIVALYLGEDSFIEDLNIGRKVNLPSKFLIFDKDGNYIQTLETGYKISDFCYDKVANRIIMNFDDEIQFGYLDLNNIL